MRNRNAEKKFNKIPLYHFPPIKVINKIAKCLYRVLNLTQTIFTLYKDPHSNNKAKMAELRMCSNSLTNKS